MFLRPPQASDAPQFLALARQSISLHAPWVKAPLTTAEFRRWLMRGQTGELVSFLVCDSGSEKIAGVFNLSHLIRGPLNSAFLGYYGFLPQARQGLMRAGIELLLNHAFGKLRLHRIEANIQPGNEASLALVRGAGFRVEGFSPRYLKIGGRWRDHERWAILAEDWLAQRRRV